MNIKGSVDEIPSLKRAFGESKVALLKVPYSTFRAHFCRNDDFELLTGEISEGQAVDSVVQQAVSALRKSHRLQAGAPNDFTAVSSEQLRANYMELTRPFRIASGLTALVSALLAVSVGWYLFALLAQQRRREIGIRRALGANRGQVFLGHVVEACTLLGTSIFLGVLMSWAATWFVQTHLAGHNTNYAVDWKLFVGTSLQDVLITCSLWAVLGACMALFPVRKVLKMSPCELLK